MLPPSQTEVPDSLPNEIAQKWQFSMHCLSVVCLMSVYFPYCRGIVCHIRFKIPQGKYSSGCLLCMHKRTLPDKCPWLVGILAASVRGAVLLVWRRAGGVLLCSGCCPASFVEEIDNINLPCSFENVYIHCLCLYYDDFMR